jgi:coproporphyrinogen III oxidase-like Fe-S oxidoreductase
VPSDGSARRLPPRGVSAPLAEPDRAAEAALLALRTRTGLPATALEAPRLRDALTWGLEAGLLERTPADALVLTLSGRLLSNEVFVRLV